MHSSFSKFWNCKSQKMNQIICEMSEALSNKESNNKKKDEILREARQKADDIMNETKNERNL